MSAQNILVWLNFFIADVRDGFGPYLGVFLKGNGFGEGEIGAIATIANLIALLLGVPFGILVDKSTHKRTLISLCIGFIIASLLLNFLFPSLVCAFLAQLGIAVGAVFLAPAFAALTLGIVGRRHYAVQFARNEAYRHAGSVFASVVCLGGAYYFGIGSAFVIVAVLGSITLMGLWLIAPSDINDSVARGDYSQEPKTEALESTIDTQSHSAQSVAESTRLDSANQSGNERGQEAMHLLQAKQERHSCKKIIESTSNTQDSKALDSQHSLQTNNTESKETKPSQTFYEKATQDSETIAESALALDLENLDSQNHRESSPFNNPQNLDSQGNIESTLTLDSSLTARPRNDNADSQSHQGFAHSNNLCEAPKSRPCRGVKNALRKCRSAFLAFLTRQGNSEALPLIFVRLRFTSLQAEAEKTQRVASEAKQKKRRFILFGAKGSGVFTRPPKWINPFSFCENTQDSKKLKSIRESEILRNENLKNEQIQNLDSLKHRESHPFNNPQNLDSQHSLQMSNTESNFTTKSTIHTESTLDSSPSDSSASAVSRGKIPLAQVLLDWRVLFVGFSLLIFHLSNAAMLPLLSQRAHTLGVDSSGAYAAATIIIAQSTMIVVAFLCGRWLRDSARVVFYLMAICFIELIVRGFVAAHYISIESMVIVQLLDGIGAGITGVIIPVFIALLLKGSGHISAGLSLSLTMGGVGSALSWGLGGGVAQYYGYFSAYALLACVAAFGLVVWVCGWRLLFRQARL